ncbi:hypothetical protein [Halohasta salina]|uniref:hypothetical protein n=1 Tax=Halohasta salina TaxID=2961621 RepID=UPI0020A49CA0|nr:hypothetical protein [Halohasta salina]
MFTRLAIFFGVSAVVLAAHKFGHYAVGRWVVGIPAAEIRPIVANLPPHIGLRDGDQWVSPATFEAYLAAYHDHDPELGRLPAYLAAGELTQTLAVVGLAGLGVASGAVIVAQSAILFSAMLVAYHLFADLGSNLHLGTPTGDFSGLWYYSPAAAALAFLLVVVPHAILYAVFI